MKLSNRMLNHLEKFGEYDINIVTISVLTMVANTSSDIL